MPTQNLLRLLLLLILVMVLVTVCWRFGSWGLVEILKLMLVEILKMNFDQDLCLNLFELWVWVWVWVRLRPMDCVPSKGRSMAPNPSESALAASLQARLFHWKTFPTGANTHPEKALLDWFAEDAIATTRLRKRTLSAASPATIFQFVQYLERYITVFIKELRRKLGTQFGFYDMFTSHKFRPQFRAKWSSPLTTNQGTLESWTQPSVPLCLWQCLLIEPLSNSRLHSDWIIKRCK